MAGGRKRWETWAMLDYGDHGLATARRDPSRVGFVRLTDKMRWEGQDDSSWEASIASIVVRTKSGLFGMLPSGLELEAMEFGSLRMNAMSVAPGVMQVPSQSFLGDSIRTGRLRRELLRRGASERPD